MSAVDHFLAKNFGQYVLILEKELGKDGITSTQQATIHSNIARAQLGEFFYSQRSVVCTL